MTTPDAYRDAEYIADVSGIIDPHGGASANSTSRTERLRKVQTAAKVAFIDRLLRDLDILIYCELSALYYMDCSIILFALRAIIQLIFFTPKAPPFDPTRNQPFVGAILGSNLFCIIFHKLFTRPEASESTRGYLHGGILIDFIGQKAPIPFARLLFLDCLILFLDLVMLGLIVERVKTVEVTASAPVETTPEGEEERQDHDLEERGVRGSGPSTRSSSRTLEDDEDVETIELGEMERTQLLADPEEGGRNAQHAHPMDTFVSGQATIMDVGLVDLVRDQWRYSPATARRTTPYVPSDQTAAFLRERFGIRVGADGRMERIATDA
ncbi:DSC4 family protein [Aspergillus luchuensis]|uniref:DUF1746 domain-containing protein n=1 Tax=Aspergillus kawachii TaxID=1069201 RepID=A0A146FE77_ASPKA|nr:uncharacterized protein AKAW2_11000S [Aspergillus luchuensis]BCR93954.1 hypothetical protein AKAW2_11000S [Aspergillus luchuensis]BCS06565.1 hypothetical protein ALUC_10946S [Aspergillus luchuensis]GAA84417.1 hypothetical protein AKAW_02532 [Aspergillus luchuensis IFO 4308]GAT23889.1 hypothetical protein RIB2604_01710310 [Aspergillus luchuensis]